MKQQEQVIGADASLPHGLRRIAPTPALIQTQQTAAKPQKGIRMSQMVNTSVWKVGNDAVLLKHARVRITDHQRRKWNRITRGELPGVYQAARLTKRRLLFLRRTDFVLVNTAVTDLLSGRPSVVAVFRAFEDAQLAAIAMNALTDSMTMGAASIADGIPPIGTVYPGKSGENIEGKGGASVG